MILTVKLFGNLKEKLKKEDREDGIRCDIKPGTTVADLLSKLDIPGKSEPVVIQNNQVLKKSDILNNSGEIRIMQPLEGG